MIFHIVGFTEKEFFDSVGSMSERIIKALATASFGTIQAAARDRASHQARTVMEVRSVAAFEDGLPAGFEKYIELFYFNNPALAKCQAAGMALQVIGTTTEPPENAGVLLRLPLYVQQ